MEKFEDGSISAMVVQHLKVVESQINNRALELANIEKEEKVMPRHAFQAINEYAPGTKFIDSSKGKWPVLRELFTSTIGVSAILAVIFGMFGIIGFDPQTNASSEQVTALSDQKNAFIDIAKIFAGAVVGAAGATAVTKKNA